MSKHGFIGDPDQGPQGHINPEAEAPGETASNAGDFIGDEELAGGMMNTGSDDDESEEQDDTTSLIGDEEDSTDTDTDDSSGDDAGDDDGSDEVEFSVSQIIRAGQAGITEAQLSQYDSAEQLESAISVMQAQRMAQPTGPAPTVPQPYAPTVTVEAWEPTPFTEQPPTDLMDETAMRDYLVRMNEHHAQQLAEAQRHGNPEITRQLQALQQNLQDQSTRQLIEQCEKQFDKLADYDELIGKGPTVSLAPGTRALTNRQAVIMEMQRQVQVHPELSFEQLFQAAFRYALQPSLEAQATKKVRKAVASRRSKASPKPSSRSGKKGPAAMPKGPQRVKAMMRDTSTALGQKAKKIFDAIK